MKPLRALGAALLILATLLSSTRASADDQSNEALFEAGVAALAHGSYDDAIDRFELIADRGFSNPDVSYDRAIAYVRRAGSHDARPGDLGRAAAALSETLLARPGDADASIALDRVRQEIVRRRARVGATSIDLKPSLGWAVVDLVAENTWATIAIIGSLVASVGIALGWAVRGEAVRLAGVVATSLGALAAMGAGSLAAAARYERLHLRPAVVVVEEARLLDENGATISGPGTRLPEGSQVSITEQRGTLAHVEWGTLDGWLSLGQLRLLARP